MSDDAKKVGFGKHADKTYSEMYKSEQSYIKWCRSLDQKNSRMEALIAYCDARDKPVAVVTGKRERLCHDLLLKVMLFCNEVSLFDRIKKTYSKPLMIRYLKSAYFKHGSKEALTWGRKFRWYNGVGKLAVNVQSVHISQEIYEIDGCEAKRIYNIDEIIDKLWKANKKQLPDPTCSSMHRNAKYSWDDRSGFISMDTRAKILMITGSFNNQEAYRNLNRACPNGDNLRNFVTVTKYYEVKHGDEQLGWIAKDDRAAFDSWKGHYEFVHGGGSIGLPLSLYICPKDPEYEA